MAAITVTILVHTCRFHWSAWARSTIAFCRNKSLRQTVAVTAAMALLIFTLLLYFEKLHFYTDFRHFYENSPIFFFWFWCQSQSLQNHDVNGERIWWRLHRCRLPNLMCSSFVFGNNLRNEITTPMHALVSSRGIFCVRFSSSSFRIRMTREKKTTATTSSVSMAYIYVFIHFTYVYLLFDRNRLLFIGLYLQMMNETI